MEILTDHKAKHFKYRYEVPEKVLADQFAHLDEEDGLDQFIKYRRDWYHLTDFLRFIYAVDEGDFKGWDGYINHTAFSGVLIKIVDSETYIIGRYAC